MFDSQKTLKLALDKVTKTASRVQGRIPLRTVNGRFDDKTDCDIALWTNGFWPGLLWLVHGQTHDERLAEWAKQSEAYLDRALFDFFGLHHDVGFMWHLSAVADYKQDGNKDSLRRGMLAASVLASRFNLAGRFIRAWTSDWGAGDEHIKWAIVDCLMNVPLLYWASAETKDPRFRQVAIAHTETVLKTFIYPDGSSRHIVEFDPNSGAFIRSHGGQGYSADSAWSRGSSWAVHGLALAARYNPGRADFLAGAELTARYFLDNLPEDQVPWADFKAPTNKYKDSSAAAIAASGLLTLAPLVPPQRKALYVDGAKRILSSLAANYMAPDDDEALLLHACGAYNSDADGGDTTLVYADYFFVEALIKLEGGQGLF